jgi:hypothetical protein
MPTRECKETAASKKANDVNSRGVVSILNIDKDLILIYKLFVAIKSIKAQTIGVGIFACLLVFSV